MSDRYTGVDGGRELVFSLFFFSLLRLIYCYHDSHTLLCLNAFCSLSSSFNLYQTNCKCTLLLIHTNTEGTHGRIKTRKYTTTRQNDGAAAAGAASGKFCFFLFLESSTGNGSQ
uniref:Putative secreted protein n=1 Tax=Anopheles marajoara TaxID=58244 RepID=A0A2M4C8R1_9DIPT